MNFKRLIKLESIKAFKSANPFRSARGLGLGKESEATVFFPYGLTANVPVGGLMLTFQVEGQESNKSAIADYPQIAPSGLASGEAIVGNWVTGSQVYFKANGDIEVTGTKDLNLTITGNVNLTASGNIDLTATGDATISANNVVIESAGSLDLGGAGGPAVARLGDVVTVGSGSSAGDWPITSASTKVSAA